jgi:hypothetical protein
MDGSDRNLEDALAGLDENKRAVLRRLVLKGAFVAPVVASFAMAGLMIDPARATTSGSNSGGETDTQISDRRLKADVVRIGSHPAGFGLYRFKYLWSEEEHVGVIAQEVREVVPAAVIEGEDGFLRVDYRAIGMAMLPYAVPKDVTLRR